MALGTQDRRDAAIKRKLAHSGERRAAMEKAKNERRAAWKAENANMQRELDAVHAEWLKQGMPAS